MENLGSIIRTAVNAIAYLAGILAGGAYYLGA